VAQLCLWISLRTSISKNIHLGPQNSPGSENLLKIVNCQNGQKTVLSHLEKVGGPRYPPRSTTDLYLFLAQNESGDIINKCTEMQQGNIVPSHVLVLIVSNRIILFLYHIHKKVPSGLRPIYSIILCGTLLPVSFTPIFDMV
jgi:hypothetical protein